MAIYSFSERFQNFICNNKGVLPGSFPKVYASKKPLSSVVSQTTPVVAYEAALKEAGGKKAFYKKVFTAYQDNKAKQQPEVIKSLLVAISSLILGPLNLPFSLYEYYLAYQKYRLCNRLSKDPSSYLNENDKEMRARQLFSDVMSTFSLATFILTYNSANKNIKRVKELISKQFLLLKPEESHELYSKFLLYSLSQFCGVLVSVAEVIALEFVSALSRPSQKSQTLCNLTKTRNSVSKFLLGKSFLNRFKKLQNKCPTLTQTESNELNKKSLFITGLAVSLILSLSHLFFLKQRQDDSFMRSPFEDDKTNKYGEARVLSEVLGIVDIHGKVLDISSSFEELTVSLEAIKKDPGVIANKHKKLTAGSNAMDHVFKDLCHGLWDLVEEWNKPVGFSSPLYISSYGVRKFLGGNEQPNSLFWKESLGNRQTKFVMDLKKAKKELDKDKLKELDRIIDAFELLSIWKILNKKVKSSTGKESYLLDSNFCLDRLQNNYFLSPYRTNASNASSHPGSDKPFARDAKASSYPKDSSSYSSSSSGNASSSYPKGFSSYSGSSSGNTSSQKRSNASFYTGSDKPFGRDAKASSSSGFSYDNASSFYPKGSSSYSGSSSGNTSSQKRSNASSHPDWYNFCPDWDDFRTSSQERSNASFYTGSDKPFGRDAKASSSSGFSYDNASSFYPKGSSSYSGSSSGNTSSQKRSNTSSHPDWYNFCPDWDNFHTSSQERSNASFYTDWDNFYPDDDDNFNNFKAFFNKFKSYADHSTGSGSGFSYNKTSSSKAKGSSSYSSSRPGNASSQGRSEASSQSVNPLVSPFIKLKAENSKFLDQIKDPKLKEKVKIHLDRISNSATPHSLIGVEAGACNETIKKAFQKIFLCFHPDKAFKYEVEIIRPIATEFFQAYNNLKSVLI